MLKSSKLSDRFKVSSAVNNKQDVSENIVENSNNASENSFSSEISIKELKNNLLDKITSVPVWCEYSEQKQKDLIKVFVENQLKSFNNFNEKEKSDISENLFRDIIGLGPLNYLISQENVSAVFVNGVKSIHIEISGKILNTETNLSNKELNLIINNILAPDKAVCSKSIFRVRKDNLLISVVLRNNLKEGAYIIIRKIPECDINTFIQSDITSREIFDFIVSEIYSGKNVVISGDINSCKSFFLDTLVTVLCNGKRSVLIEEFPCIRANSQNLAKFIMAADSLEFNELKNEILKLNPDYIFSDYNTSIPDFCQNRGYVSTLRASSIDSAIFKLTGTVMKDENLPEKYSKMKILTDYDYIVQINKFKDGKCKVTSVVELKPARTAALSIKLIAKLVDGKYITEIPQPLSSLRAGSVN